MNLNQAKSLADMFANREICKEVTTEPSMVLPCHNLTVAEIFRDYCRGIVHISGASGMYDTDNPDAEPQETEEYDSQEIMNYSFNRQAIEKEPVVPSVTKGDEAILEDTPKSSEESSE